MEDRGTVQAKATGWHTEAAHRPTENCSDWTRYSVTPESQRTASTKPCWVAREYKDLH